MSSDIGNSVPELSNVPSNTSSSAVSQTENDVLTLRSIAETLRSMNDRFARIEDRLTRLEAHVFPGTPVEPVVKIPPLDNISDHANSRNIPLFGSQPSSVAHASEDHVSIARPSPDLERDIYENIDRQSNVRLSESNFNLDRDLGRRQSQNFEPHRLSMAMETIPNPRAIPLYPSVGDNSSPPISVAANGRPSTIPNDPASLLAALSSLINNGNGVRNEQNLAGLIPNASGVVRIAHQPDYSHIFLSSMRVHAIITFIEDAKKYEMVTRTAPNWTSQLSNGVINKILGCRHNNVHSISELFALPRDDLFLQIQITVRPLRRTTFALKLKANAYFKLRSGFKLTFETYPEFFSAIWVYSLTFLRTFAFLSHGVDSSIVPVTGTKEGQLIHIFVNNIPFGIGRNLLKELNISNYNSIRGFIEDKFLPLCVEIQQTCELVAGISPLLLIDSDKTKPQGRVLWENSKGNVATELPPKKNFHSKIPQRSPPPIPQLSNLESFNDEVPADMYEAMSDDGLSFHNETLNENYEDDIEEGDDIIDSDVFQRQPDFAADNSLSHMASSSYVNRNGKVAYGAPLPTTRKPFSSEAKGACL